jgi:hypothetical protein
MVHFSCVAHSGRGGGVPFGLLYKGTSLIHEGSTFIKYQFPNDLAPHTLTLGVRISTQEFAGSVNNRDHSLT